MKKPRCKELEPDCLNCPFDDCVAGDKDIRRQLSHERSKEKHKDRDDIYRLWKEGIKPKDLGVRFGMSRSGVQHIIERKRREEDEQNGMS